VVFAIPAFTQTMSNDSGKRMFNTIFPKNFYKKWVFYKKLMFILGYFRKYSIRSVKMVTRIYRKY
jgi:hypothetical protein